MKKDIRLITLSEQTIFDEVVSNVVSYDINQRFALGTELVPLAQAFTSNLLIEKGSDPMNLQRGAGLQKLARKASRVTDKLEEDIRKAVSETELFMRNEQINRTMDPQERLKGARLISVTTGDSPDEVQVEILLQAESGDVLQLTL